MFETCEWNDEGNVLTPSLMTVAKEKTCNVQEKPPSSRKKRLKRNLQLLEVLRTLSTPSTLHPELPSPEATPPKRRKRTAPDVGCTGPSLPEDAPVVERPLQPGERLSRQQWRNKLKNKRRNRNKFRVLSGAISETEGQERSAAEDRGAAQEEKPQKHADRKVKSQQPRGKQNGVTCGTGAKEERQVTKPLQVGLQRTSGENRGPQHVTPRERTRLQKLKKLMQREAGGKITKTPSEEDHGTISDAQQPRADNREAVTDPSAVLRSRMEKRLNSARFRYINEQLYTLDSQEALQLFQQDPEAFTIYHTGFSQQVQRWPVNPITEILKYIKNRPSSLVVADFGCGDALLARSVRNTVHSFDLVALNDRVTVCDMAKVLLPDSTVDVAVFCLSLMGKNLGDYLQEANRVLKLGGVLLVAKVSSRFDDVRQFLTAMSQLGFKSVNKNMANSHFFLFEFSKMKHARAVTKHLGLQLKPCLYKKR
ncbi:Ribosomal RNA processing 8 [Pristimantis euphronides]